MRVEFVVCFRSGWRGLVSSSRSGGPNESLNWWVIGCGAAGNQPMKKTSWPLQPNSNLFNYYSFLFQYSLSSAEMKANKGMELWMWMNNGMELLRQWKLSVGARAAIELGLLVSLWLGGLWAQHAPIAPQTKDEHSPQPPFISFRKQSFIQEEENKSNQWIEWNERNCLNLWAAPLNGRVCGLWAGGHLRQPTSFNWFHQSISLRVFCFTIH